MGQMLFGKHAYILIIHRSQMHMWAMIRPRFWEQCIASRKFLWWKGLGVWAIPPVRLALSGRNSGKTPERPRKRSQSVSWNSRQEYGWDAPNPIIQGIWGFQSVSRIISPPVRLGALLFFRSGSGEGFPELVMEFPAVLGVFLSV